MNDLELDKEIDTPIANSRSSRIKRALEAKYQPPEHQRLDLEPKEGGKSLLHDDFGLPKVSPTPSVKLPPLNELPNEPIIIKASSKDTNIPTRDNVIKRGLPSRFVNDNDDGFVPPKSNFVSVGQTEHAWYDEKVTGQNMVDNNDQVDVESLQGLNPTEDVNTKHVSNLRKRFENNLKKLSQSLNSKLEKIENLEQLDVFKRSVSGSNGVFEGVLKHFGHLSIKDRRVVGDLIDMFIADLKLELEAKELEFVSSNDEDAFHNDLYEYEEDQDNEEQEQDQDNEDQEQEKGWSELLSKLKDGNYIVFVDGNIFDISDSINHIRQVLTKLVLNDSVDIEKIKLVKDVPIDFGIILSGE